MSEWIKSYKNIKWEYMLLKEKMLYYMDGGVTFQVASPNFQDGDMLDLRHAHTDCNGENIMPTIGWDTVPVKTESFAIIVDDPDAPNGTWDHLVAWNIPGDKKEITHDDLKTIMIGKNSWDKNEYGGPCPPLIRADDRPDSGTYPPIGSGEHRYFFKIYALDTMLDLDKNTTKEDLESAMKGHILGSNQIMGKYIRE